MSCIISVRHQLVSLPICVYKIDEVHHFERPEEEALNYIGGTALYFSLSIS